MTKLEPQIALRSSRKARPAPRMRNALEHQARLVRALTPRDRWLLRMLYEHKVLTTNQIIDLAFPSRRAANHRLTSLYEWGVIHRFQPHRETGSYPMHYVLDTPGAAILAYEAGLEPSELPYTRDRATNRAYSLRLAHDVACNSLFTSLVRHARQPDTNGRLTAWWSASRCKRLWGDIVTPDGYGRWSEAGREIEWFLEFDFGTEQLSRVASKIYRYGRLAAHTGITTPVLFWLPTTKREVYVRTVLRDALNELEAPDRVPIATTSSPTAEDPLDMATARWQRVGPSPVTDRVTLTDLATLWPDTPEPSTPVTTDDTSPLLAPPAPMPPPMLEYRTRSDAT